MLTSLPWKDKQKLINVICTVCLVNLNVTTSQLLPASFIRSYSKKIQRILASYAYLRCSVLDAEDAVVKFPYEWMVGAFNSDRNAIADRFQYGVQSISALPQHVLAFGINSLAMCWFKMRPYRRLLVLIASRCLLRTRDVSTLQNYLPARASTIQSTLATASLVNAHPLSDSDPSSLPPRPLVWDDLL